MTFAVSAGSAVAACPGTAFSAEDAATADAG